MNKIFLAGCLIMPVWMLGASAYDEIGVNVGATSLHNSDGIELKNFSAGVNYQINDYIIKPRIDFDYVKVDDFDDVNTLLKGSLNAVYEHDTGTDFTPYVLGGVGYEYVDSAASIDNFESNAFVQGGVGFAYDITDGIKAKVEGKVLQILGGDDQDNEVIITAGVSFPLKPSAKKLVVNNGCPIKIDAPDEDRDGIEDSLDQCPHTPCNYVVDAYGCTIKAALHIKFAVNSSMITAYSMPKVQKFATFLMQSKGSTVVIEGHTDSDGSSSSNLSLSQRRAESVVRELVSLGVSPARLAAKGFGEIQPIATNNTKEGKTQNRRIDAKLTYPINGGR